MKPSPSSVDQILEDSLLSVSPPLPARVCTEALDFLDMALSSRSLDERLLSVSDAPAFRREILQTVDHIRRLDLDRLLAKQSWLARFTGAWLEERLKFELAARRVSLGFDMLDRLIGQETQRIALMQQEALAMSRDLPALEQAINYAQKLAEEDPDCDPSLRDRLERKLANLITMRSANEMAIAQIQIAQASASALKDRFSEIAGILFPLWQQQLFAILHSGKKLQAADESVTVFKACNAALEDYFLAETRL